MSSPGPTSTYRFADFELDLEAFALRRSQQPVRLERRAMDLLILLIERHGQLISRADIVEKLWGKDVFVDVETGVNTAIRKVRMALQDDADAPTFIETVPGKGYRFVAPLRDSPSAATSSAQVRLAVLPFVNLGSDPDREYLAAGLTEEAIAAVGQIDPEKLSVIGRTSVQRYKGTTKSLDEIGSELKVGYLIEGSVRGELTRLRITARLVRVPDEVQIWSASYDSEAASLLTLQRELATAIAEQIRLRLLPGYLEQLARRRAANPVAYDLYLRGRYYWNQLTPATTKQALEYYTRAVELDSRYTLAWSGLADALSSSTINGDADPRKVWKPAENAAQHAIASDPELAEAQISIGFVNLFIGWQWTLAEKSFRKAIALDPNFPLAHRMLGVLLGHMGCFEEARLSLKRTRELDPLVAMHHALSAQVEYLSRNYKAGVEFARRAVVVDPNFWIGHLQLGQAAAFAGEHDLAIEAFQAAARLSGGNSKAFSLQGHLLARLGRVREAEQIVEMLDQTATQRYVPPFAAALILAGLQRFDEAFERLDRAFETRDVHLIYLPVDVKWDPLRSDPRFSALLKRCGLFEAAIPSL